jgi:hypothetical protein
VALDAGAGHAKPPGIRLKERKEEGTMLSLLRHVAAAGAALTLTVSAAHAAEQPAAQAPVTLSDHELDQVAAGAGSLLDLNTFLNVTLKNISVNVNVSNVPINAAVVVQANALGTAAQTATVQALQEVTQLQSFAPAR